MAEYKALQDWCKRSGCPYSVKEPMSRHTTFQVGGRASLMISPANEEQLSQLRTLLLEEGITPLYLGRGSNILVRDGGIDGVVVHLDQQFGGEICVSYENSSGVLVRCPAGKKLGDLCQFAQEEGLTGLEFAWGIPGSVGGAVYMNAGAYGGEIQDVLVSVQYQDYLGRRTVTPAKELKLGYRHSIFAEPSHKGSCITSGLFRLQRGNREEIRQRMEEILEKRKSKQPLEYPSAGSTFKRPEGAYASALIDQCGLRGKRCGGAMVSEKHAGFLINYDHATARDILNLAEQVQQEVKERTGFWLELEVEVVGNQYPADED